MPSKVVVQVGNRNFEGWNRAKIRRSMQEFLGSFELDLVGALSGSPFGDVKNGDQVKIFVTSDAPNIAVSNIEILTGFIDNISRSRAGDSTSVRVSGRDITQDLVDCSASVPSNTWTKATLEKIATDLAKPFGLYVEDRTNPAEPFKNFTIQNGESAFAVIERAARQLGVLPLTNRFGDVVLDYAVGEDFPTIADLVEGENILSITESHDIKARFSDYTLRGQNSGEGSAWDKSTTRLKAKATDKTVGRHRPLIVLAEGKTNQAKLQQRANWEAQVRAGRSLVHTVQLRDWFTATADTASALHPWTPNSLVNLRSDALGLNLKRLITSVEFSLGPDEGRTTTLELMDPRTYAKDPDGKVDF